MLKVIMKLYWIFSNPLLYLLYSVNMVNYIDLISTVKLTLCSWYIYIPIGSDVLLSNIVELYLLQITKRLFAYAHELYYTLFSCNDFGSGIRELWLHKIPWESGGDHSARGQRAPSREPCTATEVLTPLNRRTEHVGSPVGQPVCRLGSQDLEESGWDAAEEWLDP